MKNKIVNLIMNFITKNKECGEIQLKTIRYGLEGLYSLITKLVVVFFIAILTKTLLEFVLLFIFYTLLRRYSFGLHASNSAICWIVTLIVYIGGALIIKYCTFNIYFIFLIWLIAMISFILWAPADTPKRPLIRSKLRRKQKIKTCIICSIYLIALIFIREKTIANAITIALLVQTIMINPLSYKITKTQFNNYKLYPNKV